MKKIVIFIFVLTALFGCKKEGELDVFYVSVNGGYYGGNTGDNIDLDLDRDGTTDINITKNTITDGYFDQYGNYITSTNNSIEFSNKNGGNDVEFSALDDCMELYYSENEISSSLKFEESVTLANDYDVSCNQNQGQKYYIGFRIKKKGEWHNGWMMLNYDLNYNNNNYYNNTNITLNIEAWAFHNKSGKSIWTDQAE